ncbi:MAG TPA: nuclear transport factor 2 family protein [Ferrovibrio sp.]|uniref:nuclear transport factor 2 family protein n=1 Tax=Ferrovibrio sp. TaxID=1917215 RepID=UPI002ED068F6
MSMPQAEEIFPVVQLYLDGLYEGDTAKLRQVFHPASHLFSATGGKLVDVPFEQWCAMVQNRPAPRATGQGRQHDRILSVQFLAPTMAVVALNCAILPKVFTDCLTFIKLDGRWQVINKTYHFDLQPAG